MSPNLLIIGGTSEATMLCKAVAEAGIQGTVSLAGRVNHPVAQPLQMRVGGFGGVDGMVQYLRDHTISHVIDATHPFAAQMSAHAVAACAKADLPLAAFTRAPWIPQPGDRWQHVPDMAGAAAALTGPGRRVLLAVGRLQLDSFASQPQHHYLLRLVDPPEGDLPLPNTEVVVARGPFSLADDLDLLLHHRIDVVVSKNAGGFGAYAKIGAARDLGLPVIMIDRPSLPNRREFFELDDVMGWIAHACTDRGV